MANSISPLHANALTNNIFNYIGQPNDQHTNLLKLGGYRNYRPSMGIFLKQDSWSPLAHIGTSNGFDYAIGNPVLYTDTSGHLPEEEEIVSDLMQELIPEENIAKHPTRPDEKYATTNTNSTPGNSPRRQIHMQYLSPSPGDAAVNTGNQAARLPTPAASSDSLYEMPNKPKVHWPENVEFIPVKQHDNYHEHFYTQDQIKGFRRVAKYKLKQDSPVQTCIQFLRRCFGSDVSR